MVDAIVSHDCINILSRYTFVDSDIAKVHGRDGQELTVHSLWSKMVYFVSTITRCFSAQHRLRGNEACLKQVLKFVLTHKNRLGLQWCSTETV